MPNGCDECDDLADEDGDEVPDDCDVCPGFDDRMDRDGDGVPDDCDPCPDDNPDDSDGDGVCNSADICAGNDDTVDADGDGVPDGCDPCPDDNPDDSDGDGVCNSADICPGHDDNVDDDGNGIPDGCNCAAEPHCLLGEACITGVCEAVSEDIELGYFNPYIKILEGGDMPVYVGFQGFTELYLSYRTLGFTPGGAATVTVEIVMVDDGAIVLPANPAAGQLFTDNGFGINEANNDYWCLFVDPLPLFGRQAIVS